MKIKMTRTTVFDIGDRHEPKLRALLEGKRWPGLSHELSRIDQQKDGYEGGHSAVVYEQTKFEEVE